MRTSAKKKRRRFLMRRKRTVDPGLIIDYKQAEILKRFVTDRGKIIPRRISGATEAQQAKITLAIKRARYLGLLAPSVAHVTERGFSGEMQNVAQTFAAASFRRGGNVRRSEEGERESREGSDAESSERGETDV
ncbi:MAG: 30S ribosomal protein S18 [Oligoflexales bacterium]